MCGNESLRLIYSKVTKITLVDDMTQIMIGGILLYSSLSLLARQSMLMLTELPGMVTVLKQFFHLEYSDSYTFNVHGDPRIEGYHYCICHSQGRAFENTLGTELQLIHFNGVNYWCWYLQH